MRGELAWRGLKSLDQAVFKRKQAQWRWTVSHWLQGVCLLRWAGWTSGAQAELLWDFFLSKG